MAENTAHRSFVDELLDEILPDSLDWERLVRRYPFPALALAAVGGFLLGRRHGPAVVAAVSSFAAAEMSRNVSHFFGQEIEVD